MSTWNPPPPPACVRRAWLSLPNGATVYLEGTGWVCQSLDLGYPTAREVINPIPDQDGSDDRTALMGPRVVTANITALTGAGARIDDVADNFGPFMVPSARPVLHYILDRPGAAERTLTLRPAAYDYATAGDQQRDIHLGFVAPDPIVRDPVQQSAQARSGSAGIPGRTYDLTYPRLYPAAGGSPSTGIIHSYGTVPVQPLVRIYGPVAGAAATFTVPSGPTYRVALNAGYLIPAGGWVDIDTRLHTAYYTGDPAQPILQQLDWTSISWPVLPVGVDNLFQLTGSATTGVSQDVAYWQDGYLT